MDYLTLTKEDVLKGIRNYKILLVNVSEEFKNDKDVVIIAVNRFGESLKYASKILRNDKEVVLEAVKNDGCALKYASKNLRNDKEVVLEAIKNNWLSLICASENLKDDKDCLELIEKIDIIQWPLVHKKWFKERMDVLDSLREKESMEKSIIHNNIPSKKIKF